MKPAPLIYTRFILQQVEKENQSNPYSPKTTVKREEQLYTVYKVTATFSFSLFH